MLKQARAIVIFALIAVMALPLIGCGGGKSVEDINTQLGIKLAVPEGATAGRSSVVDGTIGELVYTLDGIEYTLRGQVGKVEEGTNLANMSGNFTTTADGGAGGHAFTAAFRQGEAGYAQWFDSDSGVTYFISVQKGASSTLFMEAITAVVKAQR